jgi:hypothetical protein
MRVPQVIDRLRVLSTQHGIPELAKLAEQLRRRPPKSIAPDHSRPMTDELRGEIRVYAEAHPDASQLTIGNHFGVNPGRVSETLRGIRR